MSEDESSSHISGTTNSQGWWQWERGWQWIIPELENRCCENACMEIFQVAKCFWNLASLYPSFRHPPLNHLFGWTQIASCACLLSLAFYSWMASEKLVRRTVDKEKTNVGWVDSIGAVMRFYVLFSVFWAIIHFIHVSYTSLPPSPSSPPLSSTPTSSNPLHAPK